MRVCPAYVCVLVSLLTEAVFSADEFAPGEPSPMVSSREPLSYKTMGIYGRWQPYFWDGPFDFLLVQGAMVPGESATDIPGFVWPWLPADGWVVDEYWAVPGDFEQLVRRHRMLGSPLIQVVWATPGIPRIHFHREVFHGQLRIAEKYNVPCGFFSLQETPRLAWGWQESAEESTKEVFGLVLEAIKKAREPGSEGQAEWDAWQPLKTVLVRDKNGDFTYRESFDLRIKAVGEKLPEHDFMRRTLIEGLRNMKWLPDPSRIVVRPVGTEPVDVCLTNHWSTPQGEACRFSAAAKVLIEPGTSVDVIFEASLNGYDWIAQSTSREDGVLQIDVPVAHRELHTRLRVSGESGNRDPPLVAIDWIEVRGKSN